MLGSARLNVFSATFPRRVLICALVLGSACTRAEHPSVPPQTEIDERLSLIDYRLIDIDHAIAAAENLSENYYYAGAVISACEYCHLSRHEPRPTNDGSISSICRHPSLAVSRPQ